MRKAMPSLRDLCICERRVLQIFFPYGKMLSRHSRIARAFSTLLIAARLLLARALHTFREQERQQIVEIGRLDQFAEIVGHQR
jgi:hypothetical protein